MQVTVNLYASFRIGRFDTALRDYPADSTICTVVHDLGIPEEYLIMLRNGMHVSLDEELRDGDTISLLPMLEGG